MPFRQRINYQASDYQPVNCKKHLLPTFLVLLWQMHSYLSQKGLEISNDLKLLIQIKFKEKIAFKAQDRPRFMAQEWHKIQYSSEINLISSAVISNAPFNIGFISICKSEVVDISNDLRTEHFIECACSSCIEVDKLAIVLKIP